MRSVKLKVNIFDFLEKHFDIDSLNNMVDYAVHEEKFYDEDKIAQGINYEVLSCDKEGNAVIKANFSYE